MLDFKGRQTGENVGSNLLDIICEFPGVNILRKV